jgi:hypothetical protein
MEERLVVRLNVLIGLMLCQLQEKTESGDLIQTLHRLGVPQKDISDVLGIGSSGVSMALLRARKNGGSKPDGAKGRKSEKRKQ